MKAKRRPRPAPNRFNRSRRPKTSQEGIEALQRAAQALHHQAQAAGAIGELLRLAFLWDHARYRYMDTVMVVTHEHFLRKLELAKEVQSTENALTDAIARVRMLLK